MASLLLNKKNSQISKQLGDSNMKIQPMLSFPQGINYLNNLPTWKN